MKRCLKGIGCWAVLIGSGCGGTKYADSATAPAAKVITPEDYARMSPMDRDNPVVLIQMAEQEAEAERQRQQRLGRR